MKKRLIFILLLTISLCVYSEITFAQFGETGAFGSIINFLKRVTTNIIPSIDNTYDLGSSTKAWKTIYVNSVSGAGAIPPVNATYLTSTSNATLTNEVDLGLLSTGLLKGTVAGGVSTISAITDSSTNWNTAYTDRLKWDGGATGLTAATGRTSLELGTLATLSSIDISANTNLAVTAPITLIGDSVGMVNQGTTTTVLHGNAAGNPSFSAVVSGDITDGTITYADIQNISASQRVLGRITALAGVTEELTGVNLKTIIGDVALTTDTSGNYVKDVADGTGIDGTASAEGATYTPTLDLTEINSATFGSGTFTTLTFDAGVTDPILTFGSGTLAVTGTLTATNLSGTNTGDNTVATSGDSATAFFPSGTLEVAIGGTGASTAQTAINTLTAVSGATNEHVLTKDTGTGNAIFKAAAGGGSVATDVIWDAAGDLVYGTGADTAARLAAGATTTILVGGGAAAPVWTTATGTGAPVRATAPTLVGAGTTTGIGLTITNSTPTTTFSIRDDGILTLPLQSGARVSDGTGNAAVVTATYTKVTLNTEQYDIQGEFDPTTNYRFTATVAGYYSVVGSIYWNDTTDAKTYRILIYKNGSTTAFATAMASGADVLVVQCSDIIVLAVNDYLELYGYHNKGSNTSIGAAATVTYMSIAKIR